MKIKGEPHHNRQTHATCSAYEELGHSIYWITEDLQDFTARRKRRRTNLSYELEYCIRWY